MSSILLVEKNLSPWIQKKLSNLPTRSDTAAYIIGVLSEPKSNELIITGSVVLAYIEATDFDKKRRLADGILLSEIAFPGWLVEQKLCIELARKCYASCWSTLKPSWNLYEELADRLPEIISKASIAFNQASAL